ncbi:uncharacterized protein LOC115261339 [Aedes albopictus]|uniref:ATP-dependent DNA helicase n=1 Tax=Aedes albopictus TaxID=7160 RepID=A0ABM1YCK7_AEDAL
MAPNKRKCIGRMQGKAKKMREQRHNETALARSKRLSALRERARASRALENTAEREARLSGMAYRASAARALETVEQSDDRRRHMAERAAVSRAAETQQHREERLQDMARRATVSRAEEIDEQRDVRLQNMAQRAAASRFEETQQQREVRLQGAKQRAATSRATETAEHREVRLQNMAQRAATSRSMETQQQREARLQDAAQRAVTSRATETVQQHEARIHDIALRGVRSRVEETDEQRALRLQNMAQRAAASRSGETQQQHKARLQDAAHRAATSRAAETVQHHEARIRDIAVRVLRSRAEETDEQRAVRLQNMAQRAATSRSEETREQREARLQDAAQRAATSRAAETVQQHEARLRDVAVRVVRSRAEETNEQRAVRLQNMAQRAATSRSEETQEQREARLQDAAQRAATSRAAETVQQHVARLHDIALRVVRSRVEETDEQRALRLQNMAQRAAASRSGETQQLREARLQDAAHRAATSRAAETVQHHEARIRDIALRVLRSRAEETDEQRAARLQNMAQRAATSRSEETQQQREARLQDAAQRAATSRAAETVQQHEARLHDIALRVVRSRVEETDEQRALRLRNMAQRAAASRSEETREQREARLQDAAQRAATSRATETVQQHEARLHDIALRVVRSRVEETDEQRALRLRNMAQRAAASRSEETQEQREARLQDVAQRAATFRATETVQQHETRLLDMAQRVTASRTEETVEHRTIRLQEMRDMARQTRTMQYSDMDLAAFHYDPGRNYAEHNHVIIGKMDSVCRYCQAQKFKNESPGLCCKNGKVKLLQPDQPPQALMNYMSGDTPESKHFLKNIRKYNSCFQMTSFGATSVVEQGGFPSTFTVQGQIYHKAGSLLPMPDQPPKFLQLYFIGNDQMEIDQRCGYISGTKREIVDNLQKMLQEHNDLIRTFKSALDRMPTDEYRVIIRADRTPPGEHERRYNAPQVDEVAVVMSSDNCERRDIIIQRRGESLQRISETHRSYDALQYPVMFPYGEDGYHFNLVQTNPTTGEATNKKVSAMDFYSYRLMTRGADYNHIVNCRQLFQQFVVDMYVKIESERLLYVRLNQRKLRVEEYVHLRDAVANDGNIDSLGALVILPSSFTGSPRHMAEYTQDAMTYVRMYGRPDLFITFTCNPTWTEIQEMLSNGQSANERHDLVARVFRQKQQKLIDVLTKGHVFGVVRCWMYTIEWQKRGLPHSHNLIWLVNKLQPAQIDEVISAELPNPVEDPELYAVVTKNMIHGPCGNLNLNSPCMKDRKCTKKYPRNFIVETQTGNDGYPVYRRRAPKDGGHTTKLKIRNTEVEIDNRWIVPYSPFLSKMFQAHINVEFCNSVKSIKYVCKYVNKGSDMAVYGIGNEKSNDEVMQYQLGRYVSSNEAVWRIFGFPIHERHPTVVHLSVHLENGQRVYFTPENVPALVDHPPNTTLTAFFQLCQDDPFARTLLYPEVPRYYTWNASSKTFQRRKVGQFVPEHNVFASDALGRVYTVHPNNAECYYLRMLLHSVRGPRSFAEARTVNQTVCQTFREACQKLGLLEGDQHWDDALREASLLCLPEQIRRLFAIILTTCAPSNPNTLWEKYKKDLSEDMLYHVRRQNPSIEINFNQDVFNQALIDLENKCVAMVGKSLSQLGLPAPTRGEERVLEADYIREMNYNKETLDEYVAAKEPLLNEDQKISLGMIMDRVTTQQGGIIFLDASGGTGKTFLTNLVLAKVRAQGDIALAIASSGIAATLMDGGRTAHSALKLPLDIARQENPICNISKTSGKAQVLKMCKLIIWDECTMAHKKALEALDATLKDIRGNNNLMGGAVLLLCGDFRQTLPVIPKSTPADEIYACLKYSSVWKFVVKTTLKQNMRVHLGDEHAETFANKLLAIGEGRVATGSNGLIRLPPDFCNLVSSVAELIDTVYPEIAKKYRDTCWLRERAILSAKNEDVNEINNQILAKLPGLAVEYKSIDTVEEADEAVNFPQEFLNSLDPSGMPPHRLFIKEGCPIILLRNLDPPKLCNGTRLCVQKMLGNVIEAVILTGKGQGESVFIPRIPLVPSDLPFSFKRLQFPVRLAFSITINKSQGQSIKHCGVDLRSSCFSHGQLYVACSRVGSPNHLCILAPGGETKNVVYRQYKYFFFDFAMAPNKRKCIGRMQGKAKKMREQRHNETALARSKRLSALRERARASRALENTAEREARLSGMAYRASAVRALETVEQSEDRRRHMAERAATSRAAETQEQHEERLQDMARRATASRAEETDEQREVRLLKVSRRAATSRSVETPQQREARQLDAAQRATTSRAEETVKQREARLHDMTLRMVRFRAEETDEQREVRLHNMAQRAAVSRSEETQQQREARLQDAARRAATSRADETDEHRAVRLQNMAQRAAAVRSEETQQQREARMQDATQRAATSRAEETDEQRAVRLRNMAQRAAASRSEETQQQREARLQDATQRAATSRAEETDEQRAVRLRNMAQRAVASRSEETQQQREARLQDATQRAATSRAEETDEQRAVRLRNMAQRAAASRSEETQQQREARLQDATQRAATSRAEETDEQREVRLRNMAQRVAASRSEETQQQREARLQDATQRAATSRADEIDEHRAVRLRNMAQRAAASRSEETQQQREARLQDATQQAATSRAEETDEQRAVRLQNMAQRAMASRSEETQQQREARLQDAAQRAATFRATETVEHRTIRLQEMRNMTRQTRTMPYSDMDLAAFHYDPGRNYAEHNQVVIGKMDSVCRYCQAQKFKNESPGLCCKNGKVKLLQLDQPPEALMNYMSGDTPESKHFLKNIRKYNSCFQMTSFGATSVVEQGGFPSTFTVQGQIYHKAGSLLPLPDQPPKFLQLYFIGNDQMEVDQRCSYISGTRREIVDNLQKMLQEHNDLIRTFKAALDRMPTDEYRVIIRADRTPPGEHERRYNAPQVDEVAVVMSSDNCERRDIIIQRRGESLQRISETHRSYDALQYPVMFPYGEDGYHFNLVQTNLTTGEATNKKVSAMDFYSYRLMTRGADYNHIVNCRQLFQQFVVDMYVKIESERLLYVRLNQRKLRVEQYVHLRDAVANDGNIDSLGTLVILPSSFTGSPRHMAEYTQDAMTYVRMYGRPDLFITFTCNPTWTEIQEMLSNGQSANERHDLVARVFRQKQQKLIDVITKGHVFGVVRCWMYTIEWQKRGLPHSHNLIWLVSKLQPAEIDEVISAELPNPVEDPELSAVVTKNMIHGPCGNLNPNSPCMKDRKCTKKYPRNFIEETQTGNDGYPVYRRRAPKDGGRTTKLKIRNTEIEIDNRWIVPYSPFLSKMFQAHINVEYCNSVKSIKYVCKYVNKGSDMAVYGIGNEKTNDEVMQYQLGRYVSSNEAVWRIFGFPIHERHPTVVHLSVHLENGQRVYFTPENVPALVDHPPNTTLTAFFQLCQEDPFARTLLYPEVPRYYTWNASSKTFQRRKVGQFVPEHNVFASDALGRVYTVHPNNAECYYLRMLLHSVRGPRSFAEVRTVNQTVCQTFREACQKLGLLEGDQHWDDALREAALLCLPEQIRSLFAIILTTCAPSNPNTLWEKYKKDLSEDMLYHVRRQNPSVEINFNQDVFNQALIDLENKCVAMVGKTLSQLGLPAPTRGEERVLEADYIREMNYNKETLDEYVAAKEPLLNEDQKISLGMIMDRVSTQQGGIIFLDASGGTGKTFLTNLVLAKVRAQGDIALAIASSGIAATLMDGGRTAHSALKLPLDIARQENPICNISKTSGRAQVLKMCKLIIWDECTMAHKKALEALDATLKDIRGNNNLMGGALLLLCGDFRQTLPVIPKSTPADEIYACLKYSSVWKFVVKVVLLKLESSKCGTVRDSVKKEKVFFFVHTASPPARHTAPIKSNTPILTPRASIEGPQRPVGVGRELQPPTLHSGRARFPPTGNNSLAAHQNWQASCVKSFPRCAIVHCGEPAPDWRRDARGREKSQTVSKLLRENYKCYVSVLKA